MKGNEPLHLAILSGDRIAARETVKAALTEGDQPLALLRETMIPAMQELGESFSRNEALLPDLLVGARGMQAALDVIEPLIEDRSARRRAKVCIGSIRGDHHEIGKNIVAMMLRAGGYEVVDLGVNCTVDQYAEAVDDGAQAVLCSCLTMSSAPHLKDVVERFQEKDAVAVVLGGAGVTREFAKQIGAHGYGADAAEALTVLNRLFPD